MRRYQFDILGLSEVRWVGSSETEDKSIIFFLDKVVSMKQELACCLAKELSKHFVDITQ